jgi:hypothetical protein
MKTIPKTTRVMAWDCDCERYMSGPKKGQPVEGSDRIGPGKNCFNKYKRLHTCFLSPGLVGREDFTDIDGAVEKNHRMLMLEIKSPGTKLPIGQEIMYKNLSRTGITTILILSWADTSNPETLTKVSAWFLGRSYDLRDGGLATATHWIKVWRTWAVAKPIPEVTVDSSDLKVMASLTSKSKMLCDNETINLRALLGV